MPSKRPNLPSPEPDEIDRFDAVNHQLAQADHDGECIKSDNAKMQRAKDERRVDAVSHGRAFEADDAEDLAIGGSQKRLRENDEIKTSMTRAKAELIQAIPAAQIRRESALAAAGSEIAEQLHAELVEVIKVIGPIIRKAHAHFVGTSSDISWRTFSESRIYSPLTGADLTDEWRHQKSDADVADAVIIGEVLEPLRRRAGRARELRETVYRLAQMAPAKAA